MSYENVGSIEGKHNSEKFHTVTCKVGDAELSFECGRIAKQASGAIVARIGDSQVLTTACQADPRPGLDFFPLTVEYVEKTYASGKIPGGFFKREARPREHEILNARITDRSVRPLFPDGFRNEVQIISTVISHDGQNHTDALALCAASMALHVSEMPFGVDSGPIAGVRVARVDGNLVAFPTMDQREGAEIDLVVAVSKDAIVMVEGGAEEADEADVIDALFFAHTEGQKIIKAIHEMREVMGKEKIPFSPPPSDDALKNQVREIAMAKGLGDAIVLKVKHERYAAIDQAKKDTMAALESAMGEEAFADKKKELSGYFGEIKSETIRGHVIKNKARIDGRKYDEIRPLCCEVGVLPRTHGSSIFTRGETQAIVTCTLGSTDDEQKIDSLMGVEWKNFLLHYNFPPFSVGEARMLRSTSRRELGHGALAERAVSGMIPSKEAWPYTTRIVSEITESNGSSSMASVCGASMALMDAGVPIERPIAGIAMGLIQEGKDIAVLSDILGDEDHIGDMDFKVCGTEKGITAIQMDIKIDGLTKEILTQALEQAKAGRLHMLKGMLEGIKEPRAEISPHAPKLQLIKINPDKIRDIIGPGGKVIRDIVARTGVKMDVEDDGTVRIYAVNSEAAEQAKGIVEDLTREAEVNRIYKGLVRKIVDFGAFVEIFPGTDGLVHISELSDKRVREVGDVLEEGDEVLVKVLSIDRDGKIRLSRRQAVGKDEGTVDVGE
jgi:polyribonucleotide nucleotidyltransferase